MTPPDLKRCQAEKPNGTNFLTLGGTIGGRVRCDAAPTVVATEAKKGRDGKRGAMALCDECSGVMVKQLGPTFATFKKIRRAKGTR